MDAEVRTIHSLFRCHGYIFFHVLSSEMMCSVFSNIGSSSHLIAACAEGASPGGGTCLKQLRPFMVDTPQRLGLYYLFYLFPSIMNLLVLFFSVQSLSHSSHEGSVSLPGILAGI